MKMISRAIFAIALIAGVAPAIAQAPPPVPALPDTERRTSYSLTASTCTCSVGFALYGDSTDFSNWLEVWVDGQQITQSGNWTITSPTGSLGTIPRPITDAVLTFTAAQTGTVQIVGARRPRRTSQFSESRGVAARDLNQVFTDVIATMRETWDKTNDVTGRSIIGKPGETMTPLPSAATRASKFLFFDSLGNPGIASGSAPVSPITNADMAPMPANTIKCNNTGGSLAPTDCTPAQANVMTNAVSNYFKSGRPWADVRAYGAVGDSATDDTLAFSQAVTALNAIGGGVLYVPPGTYCIKTGPINIASSPIRVVGASALSSILSVCGTDVTLITLNYRRASIEHLGLVGKGAAADTFGATQSMANIASSCTECLLSDIYSSYGASVFNITASDMIITNVFAGYAYGSAIISDSGAGNWYMRVKLDQSWPTGQSPTVAGSAVPAWSAGAAVALHQVVQTGGYVIQCTQSGTTGGVAPTLANYGVTINDNTAKWSLAGAATYSALLITGANSEHALTMMDMSGSFTSGLRVIGSVLKLSIDSSTIGQQLAAGIDLTGAGKSIIIANNEIAGGRFSAASTGISIGSGWAGQAVITGNVIFGAAQWGIAVGGGLNTIISNNQIFAMTSQAILVSPNVNNFSITGNMLGASASFAPTSGAAVLVAAGTSDYYNITNNVVQGLGVTDNGTGAHKTISGNN